ncbi:MAG: sugar ABC transporter substrate-binding protein [Longimicrobiales bacterium]
MRRSPGFHQLRSLAVGLAFLWASGCADASRQENGTRANLRIAMVTHGQSADPFWSVVANGARAAAADLGVRVDYQAPTRFDMVELSQMIDAVVATRPSGLIVSIPDAAALSASIDRAVKAGIPIVSINSGGDVARSLGVLAHVGQSEYDAGFAAGERLGAARVRHTLCVNHEVGNNALDQRCAGLGAGLAPTGGRMRVLAVELADPDDAQQRVAGALRADTTLDAVLTLATSGAEPTLAALQLLGRAGVRFATFDLSPRVLEAVRDGRAEFAIDQQQYLQGYLPVVLLTKYLETLTLPGGGRIIATGPGFVTRDVAAQVIDLSARGIR